jgi:hypothetical protein
VKCRRCSTYSLIDLWAVNLCRSWADSSFDSLDRWFGKDCFAVFHNEGNSACTKGRGRRVQAALGAKRSFGRRSASLAFGLNLACMTTFSASSGNGRSSAFASSQGARIQTSRSCCVVRTTGIAFGWIGSTTAFGDAVRIRRPGEGRVFRGIARPLGRKEENESI